MSNAAGQPTTPTARPPFFIVGCPRSGTTLLQILIDQHPHIAIPPESFIFQRFAPLFASYGDLAVAGNLRALTTDLMRDERIKDWNLDLTPDDLFQQTRTPSVSGVISALFGAYAGKQEKTRWGDKTPHHALCLKEIKSIFPAAQIIHLVRDGRDVAESMSRIAIGPCSILGIARRWSSYIAAAREFGVGLGGDEFIEVKFEDMVREPDATRTRIFSFLGEDAGVCAPVGENVPETAARQQAVSAAEHHASLKSRISESKTGVFRDRFSDREIAVFESVAGDALGSYGYELLTDGSARPTAGEKLKYFIQDNVWRYVRKFFQPSAFPQLSKELKLAVQSRIRRVLRRAGAGR